MDICFACYKVSKRKGPMQDNFPSVYHVYFVYKQALYMVYTFPLYACNTPRIIRKTKLECSAYRLT